MKTSNKKYMRDWSFLQISPDEYISCGKHGVSKKGRDYINGLIDQIIELQEQIIAQQDVAKGEISSPVLSANWQPIESAAEVAKGGE